MAEASLPCDRVRVLRAAELDASLVARWADLQTASPALASPFFRPEYTRVIAAVREDVRVAVLESGGKAHGFFPFQPEEHGGGPVGAFLTDYQGVIAAPELHWSAPALLRASGLATWRFDHVPESQAPFRSFRRSVTRSPAMDLTSGFSAYAKERREAGSEQIKKAMGLRRKLERERGAIEVEIECGDAALLRLLMRWKSRQYVESGKRDLFALPWVVEVMERLLAERAGEFAGMLSILRVAGQPVAAHFGLRSGREWHYWLPTYDPEFAHFSPGILLLLAMGEAASGLGITRIDLGVGRAQYKERLMNAETTILEGVVPAARGRAAWVAGRRWLLDCVRRVRRA